MKKLVSRLALSASLLFPLAACAAEPADTVFLNGVVVTLDRDSSIKQAVAVRGDKIVAVGKDEEIKSFVGPSTQVRDLGGQTLVPGFFAAHDHFPGAGRIGLIVVDLNSPPIGKIRDIDELIAALKERAKDVPPGKWIIGRGYDDTLLKEQRHPNRYDLDKVSTEHPIWITHISGHLGVANSRALELAKITRDTPQPGSGRIRKDPNTGEPDGVFEESMGLVTKLLPGMNAEQRRQVAQAAVAEYARRGVTTAVIAGGSTQSLGNLRQYLNEGILKFRIITMTSGGGLPDSRKSIEELKSPLLKAGAIKLLQDGSIQGFTGYLSHPYCTAFEGDPTYRGYPTRSREKLVERVKKLHRDGYQIAIHGNGDAAIEDIIYAFAEAQKELPRPDARHRIEHSQTVREDQLDRMKELGITPSYFAGHVYYWGDRHAKLFLGPERASRISPLASTLKRQIPFTLHDDTPVTPVNPLQLVWVATNRLTTSGQVLGPEQRIDAEHALRAVTSYAAWQNFEEDIKGTIEPGKLADFVILDQNPLAVAPEQIRKIEIIETIVGGQTIYRR